ncbi:RraA family protein [Hoeflea sp. YIM 152468]|uniref:RraA family protein n=1 Tax=Hoeflea sp. YIM 152468 TaxID=3031759 RepID=UPI0023DB83BC|nr:RraA family protein [Hoeflea sp. YIM 152468]MDF1608677.1 RraA family protein [Hoeflea sp. YIM 152468]
MAFEKFDVDFRQLAESELAAWRSIPTAVASDCMNRTQVMHASIKPISPGMTLAGQARTVTTMVGDCASIVDLISIARPGEVLVVDAGGYEDVAVWGGMMTEEAHYRKLDGALVWGAVRDVQDIRALGFNMFCNAVVPRGPHQGFGGVVDGAISAAGVTVRSGDIILGDEDGVTVVPLERAKDVLARAQAHMIKEHRWIEKIRSGKSIHEVYSG